MGRMKKRIWIPVCFVLLFFTVFIGSMMYWQMGWKHTVAEDGRGEELNGVTKVINDLSGEQIITVDSTFYNYRYDREIWDSKRDQGAQGCIGNNVTPYDTFNELLNEQYKNAGVTTAIFSGNFLNYYGGLVKESEKQKFPGYSNFHWAANIANRIPPYDAVCQGIVAENMSNFPSPDPTNGIDSENVTMGELLTRYSTTGSTKVPYFDASFLNKQRNKQPIGVVKEHVGFPFRKITSGSREGYYEFDSEKDVVRFHSMGSEINKREDYYFGTGSLEYYSGSASSGKKVYCAFSDKAQFFPYNQPNKDSKLDDKSERYMQDALDYGFGIRYNIPFRLSEDGKVNGKDMVFEFQGDDDVWVFVDGKLVLDLGGQHGKAHGTINFGASDKTAQSRIENVTRVNGSSSATETALSNSILKADTYVESQTTSFAIEKDPRYLHVITVFYMERGMYESNFKMSFNFVPVPAIDIETPTPAPTSTPNIDTIQDGSLTVQNKMVIPSINPFFSDTVESMVEDDVFSYSIQNKGTQKTSIVGNDIKYPSGKLTVRKNANQMSHLSFGAEAKIRVYLKMEDLMDNLHKWYPTTDGRGIDFADLKYTIDSEENIINVSGIPNGKLYKFNNSGIYYFDYPVNQPFSIELYEFESNGQKIRIMFSKTLTASTKYDGYFLNMEMEKHMRYKDGNILIFDDTDDISDLWSKPEDPSTYPPLGGGSTEYSTGYPCKPAGAGSSFSPNSASDYNPVSQTSYQLAESYLAPTDSPILVNSRETSGQTDVKGKFGLFYDDSATFLKQFSKGSTMKIVQNEELLKPERYSSKITSDTSPDDAITKFVTAVPEQVRKTADYYYTKVDAISKNGETEVPIPVNYKGEFRYQNGSGIESEPVNITQKFTNTVKTGSLTISKALKGNKNDASRYKYTFQVTFSNVFGGSDGDPLYKGNYELVDVDGTTTSNSTSSGDIVITPGQKAIISGIPVGTEYSIQEKETPSDASVVSKIKMVYKASLDEEQINSPAYTETTESDSGVKVGITIDKKTRTIRGIIPCAIINKSYMNEVSEYTNVDVQVTYTNQFGSIAIQKVIAGDTTQAAYDDTVEKGKRKKFKFYVTKSIKGQSDQIYSGDYKVYTYSYKAANSEPEISVATENTTDGYIFLEGGQEAEICELSLTENAKYNIKEINSETELYYLEAIKVTEGEKSTDSLELATVTSETLTSIHPDFQVTFQNRYSISYIQIEKYVDALYNGERKYATLSYQDLTKANQSFLFKVKQYKSKTDAEEGNENYDHNNVFEVAMNLGDAGIVSDAPDFAPEAKYKMTKRIQVLANRYYRIEEDTSLSWKYTLAGLQSVRITDGAPIAPEYVLNDEPCTNGTQAIILKSYLDKTIISTAQFYNELDPTKNTIDGDFDTKVNKIRKKN